jgi:hypothetical protein
MAWLSIYFRGQAVNEISEQKRLGDRIVALTKERDDYILKQKVWEGANDELRSAHIQLERIAELASKIDILWATDDEGETDNMDDFEFHETLDALRIALRPWRAKRAGNAALADFARTSAAEPK